MNYNNSKNKQLSINLAASFVTFMVGVGISFLLTPYIVGHLGAAAYGFVGLSINIIDYTALLTIALNSMASRFITISYIQGRIDEANKYFSSVFYSNLILAGVIFLVMGGCVLYLEKIFEIPKDLIVDVKILFSLLTLNSIIGLLTNIFAIATFVKNRLELTSLRQIVGKIIQASTIILLFVCFSPRLWYIGIAGMLIVLYMAYYNYRYTITLTPELKLSKTNYDLEKVKELISSGVWNTFNKLGVMLGQGLDLVIANLFIGATAMGFFSISRQIPFVIISLCGTIAAVFAPTLTQLYAQNDKEQFKNETNKAIRVLGFIVTIPLSFLYVFGGDFFTIWMPNQDPTQLYILATLCGLELSLSLPLEVLWNIFTVTNKLKVSSIFLFCNHFSTFIIVLACMFVVDDTMIKLIVLASTRTILGIIRSLTFLPIYGAHCIGLPVKSFYPAVLKSLVATIVTCVILYGIKLMLIIDSWEWLFIALCITMLITTIVNSFVVLTNQDKIFIKQKFLMCKNK
jgi:O-antigen/teichoic acid export membrane protein